MALTKTALATGALLSTTACRKCFDISLPTLDTTSNFGQVPACHHLDAAVMNVCIPAQDVEALMSAACYLPCTTEQYNGFQSRI